MAEQVHDSKVFTGIRLPKTYCPTHYDLTLTPDLEKFTFEGKVKIDFEGGVADEKGYITLNSAELEIDVGSLTPAGLSPRALKTVHYNKDNETATLEFENGTVQAGSISLSFRGTLNDRMKGFYRTTFKVDGLTHTAATTQFEATDARRCFPCWDEPAFKAEFTVTLNHPANLTALSNMPVQTKKEEPGMHATTYEKSPKMSTYLLAFCIGPFECIEGSDGRRPVRLFTTPGKKEQGQFALDVACKVLPFFEEYFDVKYPLPKMDLIAIPDFACGAMENWGLVTYRETCLLVDQKNTSTMRKQYVALVVAHELAHQWFGNLVTMEWWTHLWLNEGFATFMEYLCVDRLFPEYDIWSQFVTDCYGRALSLDALHTSHPIEVPVNDPSEIDEIFDDISYNKGSSVIRMLYTYIGDDCFRKGMKDYLNKFSYRNASTEDLWDALEAASNKPVRKLMSGWTSQTGYPWLSIGHARDGANVKLTLTQTAFTADGKLSSEESNVKWMIPVAAVIGSNPHKTKDIGLMEAKTTEFVVDGVNDNWLKLNPGTIGLYRSAYPEEMMSKFLPAIVDQSLSPMDRLGLQDDSFALCLAGNLETVSYLKMLEGFKNETNFTVWTSINISIGYLGVLISNTDYSDKYRAYCRNLFKQIFNKLTWEPQGDENDNVAMTRALVINRLILSGDEEVIAEAIRRYRAHLDQTVVLPADLRGPVYAAISNNGDDELYDSLFEAYRTVELHEEKSRLGAAIGYAKDPARVKRVIEFVISDEVRNQDKMFFVAAMNRANPSVSFKFLQDHKDYLRSIYARGPLMSRFIKYTTDNFASYEQADALEKFFEENKFGADRTAQQAIENARRNAAWIARDSVAVKAYLS